MNATMTKEELGQAYESYFKMRMQDTEFARYVHSLGYGITGLHNMLRTFFEAGADWATVVVNKSGQ